MMSERKWKSASERPGGNGGKRIFYADLSIGGFPRQLGR